MNIEAAFDSKYLKAERFEGRSPTFTVRNHDEVVVEELPADDGTMEKKPVLYFQEQPKGLVVNHTNAQSLKALFGTGETTKWRGKRVTLHAVMVAVGREKKLGIRVLGAPDLTAPITFELRLPRKKGQRVTLVKTGGPGSTTTTTLDPEAVAITTGEEAAP